MMTKEQLRMGRYIISPIGTCLSRCTIISVKAVNIEREQLRVEAVTEHEHHGDGCDQEPDVHRDPALELLLLFKQNFVRADRRSSGFFACRMLTFERS